MLERVYLGTQFIFLDPPGEQPLAATITPKGGEPARHEHRERAILSRYGQELVVEIACVPGEEPQAPHRFPALRLGPALVQLALLTDRKIYKPRQPIRLFVAGPGRAGEGVALELRCNNRLVFSADARLEAEGLYLTTLTDYEEGEYEATARLQAGAPATCKFTIAQHTLSPLTALLQGFTYGGDQTLRFQLEVHQLGHPYAGPVRLDLYCGVCTGVVHTREAQAREGTLSSDFALSGHGGPFHVDLVTPGGETARVDFPNTESQARERITICPLGQQVAAGLLPDEGTRAVRGLHLGAVGTRSTPLLLREVVAEQAELQVATAIERLQVVVINPITGAREQIDCRDLQPGDTVTFPVPAPYRLLHLGAWLAGGPYEASGVVVAPESFSLGLGVPDRAAPGDTVTVQLASDAPCRCLLLAHDSRLAVDDAVAQLARAVFEQWRTAGAWREGPVAATLATEQAIAMRRPDMALPAMPPMAMPAPMVGSPRGTGALKAMLGGLAGAAAYAAEMTAPEPAPAGAGPATAAGTPTRMDFPELLHCELIDMDGRLERQVKLGDQLGHWTFTAYAFAGQDYLRASVNLEASKELYVELDVPALIGPGDEAEAKVFYRAGAEGEAHLGVVSATARVDRHVSGAGQLGFPLGAPGEVVAALIKGGVQDRVSRTVEAPGRMTVVHSELRVLEPGDFAEGQVLVFPSLGFLLQESAEALLRYPFG